MELQYIFLFDLDGTLTNSEEGIIKCVRYALDKLGRDSGRRRFIKVYRTTISR